ncbi:hypothetical protein HMPREF9151_00872 [Hoylesella saccharolytica F0055]|uniref:Uncharacterized protein n=1 Tax=Hoylesella saccharolytica F0055 TaxID=1127699 RepID=L1NFK7_9BACT|nr:hypothetical protein HMPREF9151_00872 [Hoylesella saccharolytica F0055]
MKQSIISYADTYRLKESTVFYLHSHFIIKSTFNTSFHDKTVLIFNKNSVDFPKA